MSAKLDWSGNELKLGPFTVAKVKRDGPVWAAEGSKDLGELLKDLWQDVDDAKQDVQTTVRAMLRKQGVWIA